MFRCRLAVACGALLASAAFAGPAYDERNDDVAGSDYVSLGNTGPRLIVPGDVKGGRYVSCVRDVKLASSDDSNGIVPGPTGPSGPAGPAGEQGPAGPSVQASPGATGPLRVGALAIPVRLG